jgi:hypothetical protein
MSTLDLPVRRGGKPRTGPSVPHVQLSDFGTPEIRESLRAWMSEPRPAVRIGDSEISDVGKVREFMAQRHPEIELPEELPQENGFAMFLDGRLPPEGVTLLPPRLTAEFAHVHPDGSLHLVLPPEVEAAMLAKGWGERHPLYRPDMRIVMLFAPRDEGELEIAQSLIGASYRYATGGGSASA